MTVHTFALYETLAYQETYRCHHLPTQENEVQCAN